MVYVKMVNEAVFKIQVFLSSLNTLPVACISGYLFYFERPLERPKKSTHICLPKVAIGKSRKELCVSPAFALGPMMPRASLFSVI